MDADYNAKLRKLAENCVHILRSFQFGNSSPEAAKYWADRVELVLQDELAINKVEGPEDDED